jgi:outer membrane protein assembly factor BamB
MMVYRTWKNCNRNIRCNLSLILLACSVLTGICSPDAGTAETGHDGPIGVCVVLEPSDAREAIELHRKFNSIVQCLYRDEEVLNRARAEIRKSGVYGRVSAIQWDGKHLPYVENFLNLVVSDAGVQVPGDEIARVLAPGGILLSKKKLKPDNRNLKPRSAAPEGWFMAARTVPPQIDEWTHYCHGPDGNPVAKDLLVGPPNHYQWISGPLWSRAHDTDSNFTALITANGRLFYIVDEAPAGTPGQHDLPDKWFLVARDAFNGMELWREPIADWGWRAWKESWFKARPGGFPLNLHRRVVADGDDLYVTLGYKAPVSRLDGKTGKIVHTYKGTERTNEILFKDGTLVLSMNRERGVKVVCMESKSGKVLWKADPFFKGTTRDYIKWTEGNRPGMKPVKLDPAVNMATDGKVVCLLDGRDLVCLDYETGKEKWHGEVADEPGNTWLGTLILHENVVICATAKGLLGLSRDSGEKLWTQPKTYLGHLWYEWKDVFVIDGLVWTYGAKTLTQKAPNRSRWPESMAGYDAVTGKLEKSVPLGHIFTAHHHHRCYRNKATTRYILASRRGTEFVDLQEGEHTVHNWIRGTCHYGMMPANGLQYAPPHPCRCYINEKLSGFNAVAHARVIRDAEYMKRDRLVKGAAYEKVKGAAAGAADWPTFRHDSLRTGATPHKVPADVKPSWSVAFGTKVSAPVVVGNRLFVALVDQHHVAALRASDGKELWRFAAGGRVDSPPTYEEGKVFFGSADGWVYCLRAEDGELVWKFMAAPEDRRMGAFEQVESVWPVHGSVAVVNGVVYCSAGRSSYLDGGLYLYGLDVDTGKTVCQRHLEPPEPDFTKTTTHFTYESGPGALNDILQADESGIFLRNNAFNTKLEKQGVKTPRVQPRGGFLDDTYFRRAFWFFQKPYLNYGRLIVHDGSRFYIVRQFDDMKLLRSNNYFVPGGKGYSLFAQDHDGKEPTWSTRLPVRVKALAVAGDVLFAAGPPDESNLAAFEGKKGGQLWIHNAATGKKLAEHKLASPPVFNGIAAAKGRLYLTTAGGDVICMAADRL